MHDGEHTRTYFESQMRIVEWMRRRFRESGLRELPYQYQDFPPIRYEENHLHHRENPHSYTGAIYYVGDVSTVNGWRRVSEHEFRRTFADNRVISPSGVEFEVNLSELFAMSDESHGMTIDELLGKIDDVLEEE